MALKGPGAMFFFFLSLFLFLMQAKINFMHAKIFLWLGKIYLSMLPIQRKGKIFIKKKQILLSAISNDLVLAHFCRC